MKYEDIGARYRSLTRLAAALLLGSSTLYANAVEDLSAVPVPVPDNLQRYIKDRAAAEALGKALFWDMQVGVNEAYACATCHHKAGGDSRVNARSLHPGANGQLDVTSTVLLPRDFPFGPDVDDVVGSIGVPLHIFIGVDENGNETCELVGADSEAHQVTGIHSPATVNAIFSEQQFWDGRAQSTFNGVNVHGATVDPASIPSVYAVDGTGQVVATSVAITNASLASQAVGPALNATEMSCAQREWGHLAKKLLPRQPLALQTTAPDDSVLGPYVGDDGKFSGDITYRDMVYAAFQDEFVSSLPAADSGWTVEEANFSLYWGLALNLYQALLVSDDSPWDRYVRGDSQAVSAAAVRGHEVFVGDGECDRCHRGAETSNAAITNGGDGRAFANIGLRPVAENAGLRRGEHKSVGIRNVELNNPYMWNGGQLTLRQLVSFYNRGGDFRGGRNELDVLNLTDQQQNDLVAFMLTLTDDRVRCDADVFDHPSLVLAYGDDLPAVGTQGLARCWRPALDDGSVDNFHYQLVFDDAPDASPVVLATVVAEDVEAEAVLEQAEPEESEAVVEEARAERRRHRAERREARIERRRTRADDEDEDEDEDEDD